MIRWTLHVWMRCLCKHAWSLLPRERHQHPSLDETPHCDPPQQDVVVVAQRGCLRQHGYGFDVQAQVFLPLGSLESSTEVHAREVHIVIWKDWVIVGGLNIGVHVPRELRWRIGHELHDRHENIRRHGRLPSPDQLVDSAVPAVVVRQLAHEACNHVNEMLLVHHQSCERRSGIDGLMHRSENAQIGGMRRSRRPG